jgi:hypothetical protein
MAHVTIQFLFSILVAGLYSYTIYFSYNHLNLPNHKIYGGRYKYLTFLNLLLQTIYTVLTVFLFIPKRQSAFVQQFLGVLYAVVTPISIFVTISFWSLFFIDRDLIYPVIIEKLIPSWYNHAVHTAVGLTPLLEAIVHPPSPAKRRHAIPLYLALFVSYLVWIHVIFYKSGHWVYPVLKVLPDIYRYAFLVVSSVVALIFFWFVEKIVNSRSDVKSKSKKVATVKTAPVSKSTKRKPKKVD